MKIYFKFTWNKTIFAGVIDEWKNPEALVSDKDKSLLSYLFLLGASLWAIVFSPLLLIFELLNGVKIKRKRQE